MRSSMINCDNADAHSLDVLFATTNLERVYRQSNTYYSECLKESLFTIGIAVAKGDEKRIKPRKAMSYGDVKLLWRYCLLNDSDAQLSAEAAFQVYVRQMRADGVLPKLCEYRRPLVDHLLFDIKVTNGLTNLWDVNWKESKNNPNPPSTSLQGAAGPKVMITTTASPATPQSQTTYLHFIKDLNRRSIEDEYFRRSVRMPKRLVVDLNKRSKW
ncbi:unnamed protein product [Gongylonema pulchrum]|uniref:RGS domain-containing protein n=1 Tax=Gongylonema pulchrum TaxID=637853 RepID=A0A183D2W2_9BILA|nr:unnamed protein product [Gongylonema pulchrum]